jgi:hypothetical protein
MWYRRPGCLNRLRTLARQREEYVGEWLPEPVLTSPDVAEDVELAESVSIAMLAVLETLPGVSGDSPQTVCAAVNRSDTSPCRHQRSRTCRIECVRSRVARNL